MDLFKLVARLGIDTTEYERGLDDSIKKSSGLGAGLGAAMKIGIGAIGAATAAVGAFAKSSISVGSSFDAAMSQVAATMGVSTDSIKDLRDFAKEMGSTTKFSATQAAEALNFMALAGYDANTSMEMLPNVLSLAAAGGMDLATASDMVTDASAALGLSINETKEMVDQMARASSRSNTSVSQLGDAFLTIGATARSVAGGTVELSTVLGVLADNGIKGSEGGTHLRNALLSLQTPTKDGIEALSKLNMTYDDMYDASGRLRPLPEIFMQMSGAMEGMTQQSKDAIISGIFNKTDLAAVNALIGTSVDRWADLESQIRSSWFTVDSMNESLFKHGTSLETMQKNLESLGVSEEQFGRALAESNGDADTFADTLWKMTNEGTTFDDVVKALGTSMDDLGEAFGDVQSASKAMQKEMEGNLTGDITTFKSALEGTQIALSEKLSPALREFVQGSTEGIKALTEALESDDFSGVIDVLTGLFTQAVNKVIEMAPQFIAVGAQVLQSIITGITNNGPQLLSLASTMLTNIVDGIMVGIPTVTNSAVNIINGLAEGIKNNLPGLIPVAMDTLVNFSGSLLENAGLLVDAGIELVESLADALIQGLPTFIRTVPTIVTNIAQIINQNAPKLLACGITLIGKLAAGVIQSIPVIVQEFPKILTMIANVITAFNWISLGAHIITFIKNGVTSLATAIPDALKNIGTNAIETVKGINWANLGSEIINFIVNGIQSLVTAVPDALRSIGMAAMEAFKSIDWLSLGSAIISGILSGIQNGVGSVINAMVGLGTDVINAGKKALGIASPSKVSRYWGEMLDRGFAEGITDNMRYVNAAMSDLTGVESPSIDISNNTGSRGDTYANGAIQISIYGSAGQDVRELADIVMDEMDRRIYSRRAVNA